MSRHDYLPFGEEIGLIGGRITTQRYAATDGVRQKFTLKERDKETGLDFFGARYFASSQGRFTSTDPLLASGSVYDPQSWNRYTYTSNNPLRYIDPTGMWEWATSAGGADDDEALVAKRDNKSLKKDVRNAAKNALKFRARFRAAVTGGEAAVNRSNLTSEQKAQVMGAINSFGATDEVKNGVIVGVGSLANTGKDATTELKDDGTISVTFKSGHEGDSLIVEVAHEGQHVSDAAAFRDSGAVANSSTDLNHRQREINAYTISSMTGQALGSGVVPKGMEQGKYQIWNNGWRKADQAKIDSNRNAAVMRFVSDRAGYPEKKPGNNYSEEFHPRP
jgi:RHS repeat-associated protein